MAGAEGIEPSLALLERAVLPLNDTPSGMPILPLARDLYLLVDGVRTIPRTELVEFDLAGDLLLVAMGVVITPLACDATEADEVVCVFDLCHVSKC